MKYKIAVVGASKRLYHCSKNSPELAKEVGRQIAQRDCILLTGATTGLGHFAAMGAKEAGGFTVGLSPAATEKEHKRKYRLPTEYLDVIIYTGFGYAGRNVLMTRAADGAILICGGKGTLDEFSTAFEDQKPTGVLEGTGGVADTIKYLIKNMHRGPGKIVYDKDPKKLVDKLINLIKKG